MNKQKRMELRELALAAKNERENAAERYAAIKFCDVTTPEVVIGLLDQLDSQELMIETRDMNIRSLRNQLEAHIDYLTKGII